MTVTSKQREILLFSYGSFPSSLDLKFRTTAMNTLNCGTCSFAHAYTYNMFLDNNNIGQ